MTNQATRDFIHAHRTDDVRRLALLASRFPAVDMPYALDQIQGWQTARHKLPTWAATDGLAYPPHLSMEQCSSEATACYKQRLVRELLGIRRSQATLVDLTGGFGVDFSFMSQDMAHAVYVERSEALCALARHNFDLLGLRHAKVVCGDGPSWLHDMADASPSCPTLIYIDPARRGTQGQKVYGLHDCTPDITLLRDELLRKAEVVVVKLSPMLDWHAAAEALAPDGRGATVHIVSVANECKELLLVLTHDHEPLRVVCSNDNEQFEYFPASSPSLLAGPWQQPATAISGTLLVPNASIMKAGCFAELCDSYHVQPLGHNSHLFVSPCPVPLFPGRQFAIRAVSTMNKRELRQHLQGIDRANIAVRNFPMAVADLRRRLKLADGGSCYIFATTWQSRHVLIITEKTVPDPR